MNLGSLVSRFLALLLFIASLPFLLVVLIAIKLEDGGPLIFAHKRAGKGKKPFTMYKVRTMVVGAEKMKEALLARNEADGPVFKIRQDPRHTKVGRLLAHSGLDEIPQLVNIVKGEMAFVGPRPLPIEEAERVPQKYKLRFSVLPGITSSWVVKGSHVLTFKEWMAHDLQDVRELNLISRLSILLGTLLVIAREIYQKLTNLAKKM